MGHSYVEVEQPARTASIRQLNEIGAIIHQVEDWLSHTNLNSNTLLIDIRNRLRDIKRKKLAIESHVASELPVVLEGYVGEDEEQVDQTEVGVVNEVYHYLGCPVFPTEHNRHYGTIKYDKFRDLTEIFKMNTGKFIRVIIEEIPLGEGQNCGTCENRFKCLTTKVKA